MLMSVFDTITINNVALQITHPGHHAIYCDSSWWMLELTMGLFGNGEYFPLTLRMDEQCVNKPNQTNRSKFVELRQCFYTNPGPYPRLGASLRDHRDCRVWNYREFISDLCCGEKHFFGILKIGQIHCLHTGFNMSHIAEYILIWHHCSQHVCKLFPSYRWRRLREYVNNK